MAGCVSDPEGCGLIETPGRAKCPRVSELVRRSPSDRSRRPLPGKSRAALPESARRPSSRAPPISAATTPDSAARPAWNGFVMVPKFSRSPAASLAAIPNARSVWLRSRPSSFAAAAAAPIAPHGPGAVKAVLVMARRDRFGDLALHLHADVIGRHQIASRDRARFSHRQRRARATGAVGCVRRPYTRSSATASCVSS